MSHFSPLHLPPPAQQRARSSPSYKAELKQTGPKHASPAPRCPCGDVFTLQVPLLICPVPGDTCEEPGDTREEPGDMSEEPGDTREEPGDMSEEPGDMREDSGATLTVRLVRSFEYRNFRPVVFQRVPLELTVREFTQRVLKEIETRPGLPPPFRKYRYDAMKIIHQAHGAKTNDLVMSLDDLDKPLLQENQTLREAGVANETELAFFKNSDYDAFKANPQMAW